MKKSLSFYLRCSKCRTPYDYLTHVINNPCLKKDCDGRLLLYREYEDEENGEKGEELVK